MQATKLDIYTDGGCVPNPGAGGWGVAVYQGGEEVWSESGGEIETTNNRMELTAIIKALELAHGRPCLIFTDSMLCVNTLSQWAKGWKAKGWRKADGGEVKNLDLVKRAYELFQNSKAKMVWVKGHAGNVGNERADTLASEGRTMTINSRFKATA